MSSQIQSKWSKLEQKAIKLLGSGLSTTVVATAVGVTSPRISQLMSMDDFAAEVSELRFNNLQKHNEMDDKYDQMETKLAENLTEMLPMIMKPMEILKALQVVNSMKRRGQGSQEMVAQQNTVVNLLLPNVIVQQFTTNVNNQVIQAGDQTLETIQGSVLLNAAKAKLNGLHNEIPTYSRTVKMSPNTSGSTASGPIPIADSREL